MRSHNAMEDEEVVNASWEATRGAVSGAVKWGAAMAVLGVAGYMLSPVYRSLTIQFKVYIQMSGMVLGSMMEADARLREYEAKVRMHKRRIRDQAVWREFEQHYGKDDEEHK